MLTSAFEALGPERVTRGLEGHVLFCNMGPIRVKEILDRGVARVIVRDAFEVAEAQGQIRLRALEHLNLALLVHYEHERMIGRIEVEPHDVPDFLDEER